MLLLQTAGSEALQSYDIVAAVPCCQRSFEVLCKDSDVDVISLPSGKRLPFTINKKNVSCPVSFGDSLLELVAIRWEGCLFSGSVAATNTPSFESCTNMKWGYLVYLCRCL